VGEIFQGIGIYKLLFPSIWEENKCGIYNKGSKTELTNLELLSVCSKRVECYTVRL